MIVTQNCFLFCSYPCSHFDYFLLTTTNISCFQNTPFLFSKSSYCFVGKMQKHFFYPPLLPNFTGHVTPRFNIYISVAGSFIVYYSAFFYFQVKFVISQRITLNFLLFDSTPTILTYFIFFLELFSVSLLRTVFCLNQCLCFWDCLQNVVMMSRMPGCVEGF